MDAAIKVENLSKRYQIGKQLKKNLNFQEQLTDLVAGPFRRLKRAIKGEHLSDTEDFWALQDVSFEVQHGEVVGIIGRNGAGKSTLLKILSRITKPTSGRIVINGRVASLLEVGTGFHPELTGRENIYLNGSILGMTRVEINKKFDEIVEFSEIEKFLDTPVKRYSSGMYVRLAFAVAAHLDPEILIVDEVLSVGDVAFQKKCLGKMQGVSKSGRTVLFVSHNMRAITDLCSRTICLNCGSIRRDGQSKIVVSEYLSPAVSITGSWCRPQNILTTDELELIEAQISQAGSSSVSIVHSNQPFDIEIKYRVKSRLRDCSIVLRLMDMNATVVLASWDTDADEKARQFREPGVYRSICRLPAHLLRPSRYTVTIAAHIYRVRVLDFQENVLTFDVSYIGYKFNKERQGIVHPVLDWMSESA